MQLRGSLSLRTFLVLLVVLGLIGVGAYVGCRYVILEALGRVELLRSAQDTTVLASELDKTKETLLMANSYLIWAVAAGFSLLTLSLWAILTISFSGPARRTMASGTPVRKTELKPKPAKETVSKPEPSKPDTALVFLSLLQKEGRFVDFLGEDLDGYADEQIGAAVRSVHQGCKKVVAGHLKLAPVWNAEEGSKVNVPEGFDPASIKLTGNVSGNPTFTGILRHPGWRADKVSWPELSADYDVNIIAPAEVEVL
ncbi:MAG: DUF2760 domain-containing protein [Deltaproteobacteria bacterium]|nr:DUF2760 domain-containing protein [Deltaproteobacteria bacterium]